MTDTAKFLADLVALPSVNPAFLPPGDAHAGEQRVAEFLAATAGRAGLEVDLKPVLPGRSNLLVQLAPVGRARRRVLLAPHLDTVNAEPNQFVPQVKSGRLYGRGACDTKASVAAMIGAMEELARNGRRPTETEIIFAGLVDEENAQAGSRALAASGFQAELAIVGEATGLRVVTAHKGSLWLKLETRGKSAHGSRPELGRNAVHAMARVVDLLETEYAAQLGRRRHPLLGKATISVGTIIGGTQPNIVPNHCSIRIDRRTLPGETEAGVKREIQSLLRRHGLQASFQSEKLAPCLPLETDSRRPLVHQFLRSVGQRRPAGVHYFCDASVLARGGIPSVIFGPGDIAQAHTADEWVEVKAVERCQVLLESFLRALP